MYACLAKTVPPILPSCVRYSYYIKDCQQMAAKHINQSISNLADLPLTNLGWLPIYRLIYHKIRHGR